MHMDDTTTLNRGHLACDLKWRHAATLGIIIILPKMQQFSLLETSMALTLRGFPITVTI